MMANRTYKINGETFTLTDEQEAIEVAKEVAHAQDKPMNDWKESMQGTDAGMPRSLEDVLDIIPTDGLAQATLDKYNAKKTLRSQRP
jgi:hypothetical protein